MTAHSIRPREDWLDPAGPPWEGFPGSNGAPYRCPPFRGWDAIDTIVFHYPGADWADMDFTNDGTIDLADDVAQIRLQHQHYAYSRKYSLGYCFLIGQTGQIWESRGLRNANAANLGDKAHGTNPPPWNNRTVSIQLIVDVDQPANALQVAAANWLIDHLIALRGQTMNVTYHGAGQATACPGKIRAQIEAGEIGPGLSTPNEPAPSQTPHPFPIFPEEPTVANAITYAIYQPTDCAAQFLGLPDEDGNTLFLVWVDKQRADAWKGVGVQVYDALSLGGFINCVLLGPLPTGDDRHAWTGTEFFRVIG